AVPGAAARAEEIDVEAAPARRPLDERGVRKARGVGSGHRCGGRVVRLGQRPGCLRGELLAAPLASETDTDGCTAEPCEDDLGPRRPATGVACVPARVGFHPRETAPLAARLPRTPVGGR